MPCSSDTVSQNLAPIEKGCKSHEYDRGRGSIVAIAHRFGYRTVKARKISMGRRCAGSWETAQRRSTYLAGLEVDDFLHSGVRRELEPDIRRKWFEKKRDDDAVNRLRHLTPFWVGEWGGARGEAGFRKRTLRILDE